MNTFLDYLKMEIDGAKLNVEDAAKRLREKAAWIQRDMDRLVGRLGTEEAESVGVNTLGELQSASDLNIMCAELGQKQEQLKKLRRIFEQAEKEAK